MKSRRVLVDGALAPIVREQFHAARLEVDSVTIRKVMLESLLQHGHYSALLLRSKTAVSASVLAAAGKDLRVIGVVGDSLCNINITDASHRGVLIKATDYVNAYEISNLCLRLMVTLLSRSFCGRQSGRACVIKEPREFMNREISGFELAGTTVGLIGCGRVAQSLAKQLKPCCKRIIGYDTDPRAVYENFHRHAPLEGSAIEYGQLRDLLEHSDIISIHTAGERKVFKGKELYFARQRPYIINTSRGGQLDQLSMLAALRDKRVRGVAMTLPDNQIRKGDFDNDLEPFLDMNNVLIAPALGNPTPEKKKKSVRQLAQSVIDFLRHKDMGLAVNPMDVFPGSRKLRYPVSRGKKHSAVPVLIGH